VQIRPYRDRDAPAIVRFLADAVALDPTLQTVSLSGWRAYTARSTNRAARDFAIGEDADGIAALLMSTLIEKEASRLRDFRIIVHPRAQRRGWGTRLLHLVEGQDPDREATLNSELVHTWQAGRAFAEREGFEVVRRDLTMEREGEAPDAVAPPDGYLLRPYRECARDDAAWIALSDEGYGDWEDFDSMTASDLASYRAADRFALWMVERDGEESGIVGLCHTFDWQGKDPYVNSVVVTAEARGRGLTTAGMRSALRGGRRKILLYVRESNTAARAIYDTLGFCVTGDITSWQRRRGS